MDAPYIHLLVNHFPIVLSVVGGLAALIALFTRHRTTWTFALGALLLAGLFAYPAYLTGERAEAVMEKVWFVDRERLEAHENVAKWALWLTVASGLVALGAIWRERTAYTGGRTMLASPGWLRTLVALLGLGTAALLGFAAWTGGFVVHKAPLLRQAPAGTTSGVAPTRSSATSPDTAVRLVPDTAIAPLPAPRRRRAVTRAADSAAADSANLIRPPE
ncbi:MAG TPA: hypothetical protein VEA99_03835 [Gemmatimonadaceae bacterium]|nr:hypothetical protein [Gemmatimonadaceae bacterium]